MLSSAGQSTTTAGALAASRWLRTIGVTPPRTEWVAKLELVGAPIASFTIDISDKSWGFTFRHAGRQSCIVVTSLPTVHERDDFRLLPLTPALQNVGGLIRRLEAERQIGFRRSTAVVQTNLPEIVPDALRWLAQL